MIKTKLFCALLLIVAISSCKKDTKQIDQDQFLANVKAALKDSVSADDYAALDFDKGIIDRVDSVHLNYLRVPFRNKTLQSDFVILRTDVNGAILEGKIVHLDGKPIEYGEGKIKRRRFDGTISISSLDRKTVLNSTVTNGFITAFHNQPALRETTDDPIYPSNDMPEVYIITYVRTIDAYSTWYLLNSFFYSYMSIDGGSGGGSGDYYGSADGYYSDTYYGNGGGYGGTYYEQPIQIDIDTYADKNAIDIDQYLKCFDNVPDAGAQCEITVYADIPVDSDPNKLFDFNSGSPGHTFIQIKKVNGSQSVIQNLGFYPKSGWKNTLTNAPMEAKFVDDSQHEFNASYSKTLTADEFRSTLTEIRYLKGAQYDIDNYNCTDWALDVFNKEGYGLDIPLYDIPGNYPSTGTRMPQGIYNKLLQMKNNNDVHADKISIGFQKGYVAYSNGPCN